MLVAAASAVLPEPRRTHGKAGAMFPIRLSACQLLAVSMAAVLLSSDDVAGQTRLYVSANLVTGANDGSSWKNAFQGTLGLQAALAVAADNPAVNEIWVARGRYVPALVGSPGVSFQVRSNLAVYGHFAGNESDIRQRDFTLDGNASVLTGDLNDDDVYPAQVTYGPLLNTEENTGRLLNITNAIDVVLDGLTMMAASEGLRVLQSSLQVSSCTISRMLSTVMSAYEGTSSIVVSRSAIRLNYCFGTGFAAVDCTLTIDECIFDRNFGEIIFFQNDALSVSDCTFSNSLSVVEPLIALQGCQYAFVRTTFADNGIHLAVGSSLIASDHCVNSVIDSCIFRRNTCTEGSPVALREDQVTVRKCLFEANRGGDAGAIYDNLISRLDIIDTRIQGNEGSSSGALYCSGTQLTVTNCTLAGNRSSTGYGIAVLALDGAPGIGELHMLQCTVVGNGASNTEYGGMVISGITNAQIRNSILWGHLGTGRQIQLLGSILEIDHSCIEGGQAAFIGNPTWLEGNTTSYPRFINPAGSDQIVGTADDDVRLYFGSACIDAGDNTAIPAGVTTDLDGNPRRLDDPATADTGAGVPPIVDMGAYEFVPINPMLGGPRLWMDPAGGVFENLSNWYPSLPEISDIAVFHLPANYIVSFNGNPVVGGIDVASGEVELGLNGHTLTAANGADALLRIGVLPGVPAMLRVHGGTIAANQTLVYPDGALADNGTIQSDVINAGLVNPGTSPSLGPPFPVLTIQGNFSQIGIGAAAGRKLFEVEIGGYEPLLGGCDRLAITGSATLGGTVQAHLINDFLPQVGDSLTILTAATLNNTRFDVALMPTILHDGPPRFLRPVYVDSDVGASEGTGGAAVILEVVPLPVGMVFGDQGVVTIEGEAVAATIGDFDAINGPDIALALTGVSPAAPGSLLVMLNDGSGGFTAQLIGHPLSVQPSSIAAGDLNGDGFDDLAVAHRGHPDVPDSDTVMVLINSNGNGFRSPDVYNEDKDNRQRVRTSIAIADIDGRNGPDVIVANGGSDSVTVFPNEGTGLMGFPILRPLAPGHHTPSSVDPADVDNDKDFDLVVACANSSNVNVILNDGAGGLALSGSIAVGNGPIAVLVQDLNSDSDGLPEIATINAQAQTVSFSLNLGSAVFAPAASVEIGPQPRSMTIVDLDGDGDRDIAAVVQGDTETIVRILRNQALGPGEALVFSPADDLDTGAGTQFVLSANVDGAPGEDLIAITAATSGESGDAESHGPGSLPARLVVVPNLTCAPGCAADVAPDCPNRAVDIDDLLFVINQWGQGRTSPADVNNDGIVNSHDVVAVVESWGPCR
jgi:hypothetical protein